MALIIIINQQMFFTPRLKKKTIVVDRKIDCPILMTVLVHQYNGTMHTIACIISILFAKRPKLQYVQSVPKIPFVIELKQAKKRLTVASKAS